MEDDFWVFTSTIRYHSTVHLGSCFYCNHGKGNHKKMPGTWGGEWHGPFFTLQEAMDFAEEIGYPVRLCRRCLNPY